MTAEAIPTMLQPQWFFPLFIAIWLSITGLLALVGGWASLASSFPARGDVDGEHSRHASGSIGWRFFPVHYGNCLSVTINPEGLRLSIFFMFRFLSPPLFVPWSSVESVDERQLFFFKHYVMSIRDHWPRITLRGSIGRRAKEAFESSRSVQLNR